MSDERRKLAVRTIQALVDLGISVAVIALMLRVTRQQVYRWLSGGWLPRERMCDPIDELLKRALRVKEDWTDIVTSWDGKYHAATRLTLYQPEALRILRGELAYDKKTAQLTSLTFALWAERGKR